MLLLSLHLTTMQCGGVSTMHLVASEWINALILAELLYPLPASNGSLERVFSQVNVIKSNKRYKIEQTNIPCKIR